MQCPLQAAECRKAIEAMHKEDFPNAYEMYHNEITLPLHTCLTDEQADYVIDTFCSLVK